jgi:hypothetical protein
MRRDFPMDDFLFGPAIKMPYSWQLAVSRRWRDPLVLRRRITPVLPFTICILYMRARECNRIPSSDTKHFRFLSFPLASGKGKRNHVRRFVKRRQRARRGVYSGIQVKARVSKGAPIKESPQSLRRYGKRKDSEKPPMPFRCREMDRLSRRQLTVRQPKGESARFASDFLS